MVEEKPLRLGRIIIKSSRWVGTEVVLELPYDSLKDKSTIHGGGRQQTGREVEKGE